MDIPEKVHLALRRVLLADKTQRLLREDPWLRQLIQDEFVATQPESKGNRNLHALLDNMLFCFDAGACEQLRILGDTLPCFPKALENAAAENIYVDKSRRFLAAPDDLRIIHRFLDNLETVIY